MFTLLGYFAIVGLARVNTLLGDYASALKVLAPIDLKQRRVRAVAPTVVRAHRTCFGCTGSVRGGACVPHHAVLLPGARATAAATLPALTNGWQAFAYLMDQMGDRSQFGALMAQACEQFEKAMQLEPAGTDAAAAFAQLKCKHFELLIQTR